MAGTSLGLALVLLQGALLAGGLWPARARPALLLAALAPLAGLALSSSAYFLWVVAADGRTAWFPACEAAATALAAGLAWRGRRRRARLVWPRPSRAPSAWIGPTALLALLAIVLVLLVRSAAVMPWGHWDAWAMINLKARFLCEGGDAWRWVFDGPGIHHRDYPLLLTCSVARLWRWSAVLGEPRFTALQPQALSLLTWLACLAALVSMTARLCSPGMAALAGLAFFALGWDLPWGSLQYTDFAQAGLFVWSAGVLALAVRRPARAERWAPLLGCLLGATAWCKNEGLAFAAVVLLALLVARPLRSPRAWLRLAGGGLAAGLAVVVLKLGFAAGSSVFEARTRPVLADLADPERHRLLARHVTEHVAENWTLGALPVLALAALCLPRRPVARHWLPLTTWLGIALVFAVVMVTTRERYDWHLQTAVDRLLIQLWPLAILAGGAALRPR